MKNLTTLLFAVLLAGQANAQELTVGKLKYSYNPQIKLYTFSKRNVHFSDYTFNSNFTSSLPFRSSKVLAKLFS